MLNSDHNTNPNTMFGFIIKITLIVLIASAATFVKVRLDLTEDHRFTLSGPTKKILSNLKNDIFIQVYLDGEIPVPLKRLKRSVLEMLDEFRITSGRKIGYEFINPSAGNNADQRNALYRSLNKKGLEMINVQAGDEEGGSSRKMIFPGMIINYNGAEVPINFLKNDPSKPYEENILHSSEGLEYELIQTISTLTADTIFRVAFLEGQGELDEEYTADITYNLARYFTVDRGSVNGKAGALDKYSAVVIAGPEKNFNEADKLVIDQYIMHGGKVMWLLDEVSVNSDSLLYGETAGLYRPLNIEDQLFRYGVRVNPSIMQDLDCQEIRLKVVGSNGNQQFVPAHWIYYPLLTPSQKHPITRNMNKVKGEFVNYIDTVGLDKDVKKTILLTSSKYSRTINPPMMINLQEINVLPDEKQFNRQNLPVAVLLEGVLTSAFKNRMISAVTDQNIQVKPESVFTKMIVIADADIIKNEVKHTGLQNEPQILGRDRYTGQMYGNRDFLINCLNYLVDDKGIMQLRSRELKIRLLNAPKIKAEKLKWQVINIVVPLLFVLAGGLIYGYLRRKRYSLKSL